MTIHLMNGISYHRHRYLSLYTKGGEEDYFNSQYSDAELRSRLGHVDVPCLLLTALRDEFVPFHVDKIAFMNRIVSAMPKAEGVALDSIHDLKGQAAMVGYHVRSFVKDKVLGMSVR